MLALSVAATTTPVNADSWAWTWKIYRPPHHSITHTTGLEACASGTLQGPACTNV